MPVITSNGTGGGNWSAGATWAGGVAPVLGTDSAVIAAGDTVTIDTTSLGCGTDPGAGNDGLTINGTLNYATGADSGLTVRGDISVKSGGVLYDGTLLNAAYGVRKHTLKIDCVDVVGKYKLRVEDGGTFKPNSTLPDPWFTRLASDCASGQAGVTVTDDVQTAGWKVGGLIFIPPCTTDYATAGAGQYLEGEIREIASFNSGTEIVVTANFSYTHQKTIISNALATWKKDCPVVYLTRDITIESDDPDFPAWVCNSTTTDKTKWNPKGMELKELGKSNTLPALCYTSDGATSPTFTVAAKGDVRDVAIHPGKNRKGFPGFLYALWGATELHTFENLVVIGNAIHGSMGSGGVIFGDGYDVPCRLDLSNVFINGAYALFAVIPSGFGLLARGQKNIKFDNVEISGLFYGPSLTKVGDVTDLSVWAIDQIGVYYTSLNLNATNLIVLGGVYGLAGYSYSIRNKITNFYLKSGTNEGLFGVVDMEITNLIDDSATLFDNHAGLIELKLNDVALVENDFITYTQTGNIYSCLESFASPRDNVRTSGKGALLIEPKNAIAEYVYESEVSVESGKQVVVSGYMYKDAAYNGAAEPCVELSGAGMTLSEMAFDEMTDAGGGWYLWTVSGTPTRTTQAYLNFCVIGTAGHIVVADVIVLGADVNTGDFLNWSHGRTARDLFSIKLPAADVATAVWEKVITSISTTGSAGKLLQDTKTETDKIQTIDDNLDAVLLDTGTTLPAAIAGVSVDLTPVTDQLVLVQTETDKIQGLVDDLTALAALVNLVKTETNKIQTIDDNLDAVLLDTGTTLPAQIATIQHQPLGTGLVEWRYDLTSSETGLPIADATVWVTTDISGTNIVATGVTDIFGKIIFWLDPGTYYVFCQKSGFRPAKNPDVEVVA